MARRITRRRPARRLPPAAGTRVSEDGLESQDAETNNKTATEEENTKMREDVLSKDDSTTRVGVDLDH